MKTSEKAIINNEIIRHVVCFKFKETTNLDQIIEVEKEFSALSHKISGIISLEWGKNNSKEGLHKDFSHCFIVSFESEEAREAYLPHRDHQLFVSLLEPLLDDVFVIDFTP
ncbi:MAG: Dabb family protein [Opitutales bacterium]|nr:Dabb family protein [Opitutales bacterium]